MILAVVVIADGLSQMVGVKGIGGVAVMTISLTAGTMAGGERVGVAWWYLIFVSQI